MLGQKVISGQFSNSLFGKVLPLLIRKIGGILFSSSIISETYYSPNPRHNCISGIYLSMIIKYITTTYKC